MLNTAMGRPEPLFLYKFTNCAGRASISTTGGTENSVRVPIQSAANRISIPVESAGGTLALRDLNYPGWRTEIDGQLVAAVATSHFREVQIPAGKHTVAWVYRPVSFWLGLGVSLLTLFVLATIGHFRFWGGWCVFKRH